MSLYITDPFSPHAMYARSGFEECKKCPSAAPPCPACPEGTSCTMITQSCHQCATTECVKTSSSSSSSSQEDSSGGGSNAGAIAGGVVGGIAALAIITFLIWWFVIRKKRNQQRAEESEKANSFADTRQSRKSTHSIASTVLTRASNVIQIAYIPGVTNRSPPETPGLLVPPVPPLPGASPDQHFFMPGDLRDSSWSDMSQERRSVAPTLRSSVATTIYRNDAIVSPTPAQQVMRTRAAVVSIHTGGTPQSSSPVAPDAPAVPAITPSQLAKAGVTEANNSSSIVARTVTAKPVMVKGIGKKTNTKIPAIEEQSESISEITSDKKLTSEQTASGFDASSSSDEDDDAQRSGSKKTGSANVDDQIPLVIEESTSIHQSPFNEQTTMNDPNQRNSSFLETQDGSRSNRNSGSLPPRVESPFSDVNEVK